jgi:hypothetical protein
MTGSSQTTRPWVGSGIALGIIGLLTFGEVAGTSASNEDVGVLVAIALIASIAGLLVARRPENRVSWILAFAALVGGLAGLAAAFLPPGLQQIEWWQVPLAVIGGPAWFGLLLSFLVLIPLHFPTGTPPGPRWRWIAPMGWAAFGIMSVLYVFQERFCTESGEEGCLSSVANPIGIAGIQYPEESLIGTLLYGILLVGGIAAIGSLVVRYRRSGEIERHQIKWVLYSIGLFVGVSVLVEEVWMIALGQPEPPGYLLVNQLLWMLIPVSIAIAVLRYRLYDIDRIISRTVTYAVVVGILALGVALLAGMVGTRFDDPLVVAVTTLAVAAAFNPSRRRVQRIVDRRFDRSRYDAERVMDGFTSTLQARVDPAEIMHDWAEVISNTMHPQAMGVWVRE